MHVKKVCLFILFVCEIDDFHLVNDLKCDFLFPLTLSLPQEKYWLKLQYFKRRMPHC